MWWFYWMNVYLVAPYFDTVFIFIHSFCLPTVPMAPSSISRTFEVMSFEKIAENCVPPSHGVGRQRLEKPLYVPCSDILYWSTPCESLMPCLQTTDKLYMTPSNQVAVDMKHMTWATDRPGRFQVFIVQFTGHLMKLSNRQLEHTVKIHFRFYCVYLHFLSLLLLSIKSITPLLWLGLRNQSAIIDLFQL